MYVGQSRELRHVSLTNTQVVASLLTALECLHTGFGYSVRAATRAFRARLMHTDLHIQWRSGSGLRPYQAGIDAGQERQVQ
jgi:hypothetical protein